MLPQFDNTEIAFRYKSDKDLKLANLLFSSMASPFLTAVGMKFTNIAMRLHLPINALIKRTIFAQFCGGENLQEALATATVLSKYNIGVILDYGVEGKEGEANFDAAVPEFIKAIEFAAVNKNIPFISIKITGFARFPLLEKIQNKELLSASEQEEWERVYKRINAICASAHSNKIMVLVDAEESWIQAPVDELTDKMMALYNKETTIVFNTFQMYRHDRYIFLKTSQQKAVKDNYILGAKIVRGAYMEKERARAAALNYPSPIQPDKAATDKDYDAAVLFCLQNLNTVSAFIGTHNENSCLQAARYMQEHGIDASHPHVYFSQLYGMSDNISFNLAAAGYKVSKYLPYGPVRDVMPYLMRRAQENTSVAGQTGRELSLIKKEMKRRGL